MTMTEHQKGLLAHILASAIWGAATPILKLTLNSGVPPLSLAFMRFAVALPILLVFAVLTGKLKPIEKNDWGKIILAGFLGIVFNIGLLFWGASQISASYVSVLQGLTALATAFAAHWFLKEKVGLKKLSGIMMAFLGTLFIIGSPLLEPIGLDSRAFVGNLAVCLSVASWALFTVQSKELAKRYSPLMLNVVYFFVGFAGFMPFYLQNVSGKAEWLGSLSLVAILGIVYYIFGSSLAAYSLFNYGLSRISATEAGIVSYLIPVIAFIGSIIIFKDPLTLLFVIGGALVVIGVLTAEIKPLKITGNLL